MRQRLSPKGRHHGARGRLLHVRFGRSALLALVLAHFPAVGAESPVVWVDEPALAAQPAVAPVVSARVDPFCIRAGLETYRLTIGISDPDVVHLEMSTAELTYQGEPATIINLHDDGTHGDATAGDHIFTSDGLSLVSMTRTLGVTVLRSTTLNLVHSSGSRQSIVADLALTFHYISPSVPIPPVWSPAPDVWRTTHAVGLVQPLGGSFPAHTIDYAALSRRYHVLFPDDREFLIVAMPFNTAGATGGSFGLVKNTVLGLGLPIVDSTASYGSAGVLEGIVRIPWGNARFSGTLNHEVLHRFASYLAPSLDLTSPPGNNFNPNHWGAIELPSTGFGGPIAYSGVFDHLVQGGDEGFEGWLDGNAVDASYNDLELYLMGLIGPEEVASPIQVLDGPSYLRDELRDGTRYSLYSAAGLRSVTIADVIAANGLREPGPEVAPRAFRAALVIPLDRPLTDVELAFHDLAMREWERPASTILDKTFTAATGGRATMSTSIPHPAGTSAPLQVDRGQGDDVVLNWGPSCLATDDDYAVYQGSLGKLDSYAPRACSTGGLTTLTLSSTPGESDFYIVVPRNAAREGSYGTGRDGTPRPASGSSCLPQEAGFCQ